MRDHTESMRVEFDPRVVSVSELLAVFWSHVDPTYSSSVQYKSAVFYTSDEQAAIVRDSVPKLRAGEKLATTIEAFHEPWYPAEGYHQKYYLRHRADLLRVLEASGIDMTDDVAVTDSPLATKLNAYANGLGTAASVERDAAAFELGPDAVDVLRKYVRSPGSRRF